MAEGEGEGERGRGKLLALRLQLEIPGSRCSSPRVPGSGFGFGRARARSAPASSCCPPTASLPLSSSRMTALPAYSPEPSVDVSLLARVARVIDANIASIEDELATISDTISGSCPSSPPPPHPFLLAFPAPR